MAVLPADHRIADVPAFHRALTLAFAAAEAGDLVLLGRSAEHTSELQSHHDLVCRLLLEKKTAAIRRLPTMTGSIGLTARAVGRF